jgi:hypothetical protein
MQPSVRADAGLAEGREGEGEGRERGRGGRRGKGRECVCVGAPCLRGRACFTAGNFKKDATVRPSHRCPRGHRPTVRPKTSV